MKFLSLSLSLPVSFCLFVFNFYSGVASRVHGSIQFDALVDYF